MSSIVFATTFTATETIENTNDAQEIILYPNPSKGMVSIIFPINTNGYKSIKLYSNTGSQVLINTIRQSIDNEIQLDLSGLPNGLYIYQISNGMKTITGKINLAQ